MTLASVLPRRRAGLLLHPTSLPGSTTSGTLGSQAYAFVDFLVAAGCTVWQTLPLGPTHDDLSPYQCLSVHAGNPLLIDVHAVQQRGWLPAEPFPLDMPRAMWLPLAWLHFNNTATDDDRSALEQFRQEQAFWLDDYALYMALHQTHNGRSWLDWPTGVRDREARALRRARTQLNDAIEHAIFEQFLFFHQWRALKHYANERGVLIFGDMPIFVAHDSAEVWAQRPYFDLDPQGQPHTVAGVPPDYFSATGQRWGNPHYRWDRMQADGFHWWLGRMRTQLMLFDLVRIDHFRGFEAVWEIPAEAPTAVEGHWAQVPGDALFQTLTACFNSLPVVAEDLGIITPEVEALRRKYGFPGMKILQFAFGGGATNPYLPHHHEPNSVAYTGTHDNDTTVGWYNALSGAEQAYVNEYLGTQDAMPWPLLRAVYASVAHLAMLPMQDVLALDSVHRMNIPGQPTGNWRWRFTWEEVPPDLTARLARLAEIYGRR